MADYYIDLDTVETRTAALRNAVKTKQDAIEQMYSNMQTSLDDKDSATNASFQNLIELDKQIAISVAEGLKKLISFIARSAEQILLEDRRIAAIMRSGTRSIR